MDELVEKKANAVVANGKGTLKELLKGKAFNNAVEGFFSSDANKNRFIQSAVNALTKTPKLANCDKMSFFCSLMQLASFGLYLDGRNAHFILHGTICTLVIDYKGLVTMCLRSERVSNVGAYEVHSEDHFRLVNGEVEHIVDNPWGDRGDVVGYYAVCTFKDGTKRYEVMSKADVDAIRKRSRASNNGPWVTDYNEMAKKTVFKRLSKWLPVTPELQDAIAQDDEQHTGGKVDAARSSRITAADILKGATNKEEQSQDGETIDVEAEEVVSQS